MDVKIYTTPTCPYCAMAKKFLKEHNVAYTEVNVAADTKAAQEMVEKTGQMGVPVLDIGGKLVVGFDIEEIKAALGIA
jgi:glutaredoxin-like YruB-family protein